MVHFNHQMCNTIFDCCLIEAMIRHPNQIQHLTNQLIQNATHPFTSKPISLLILDQNRDAWDHHQPFMQFD